MTQANMTGPAVRRWHKVLAGILVALVIVGTAVYQTYGHRRGTSYARTVKEHPELKQLAKEALAAANDSLVGVMVGLIGKAMLLLPSDEQKEIRLLTEKYQETGYAGMAESEIARMKALQTKAIGLLPREEQEDYYRISRELSQPIADSL
jgi:hypothetical protein